MFPLPWSIHYSNIREVQFFIITRVSFSVVMINRILISFIMLKIFMMGWDIPYILCYLFQFSLIDTVDFLLFLFFATTFTSLGLIVFLILFTICSLNPDSEKKIFSSLLIFYFRLQVCGLKNIFMGNLFNEIFLQFLPCLIIFLFLSEGLLFLSILVKVSSFKLMVIVAVTSLYGVTAYIEVNTVLVSNASMQYLLFYL